MAIFVHLCNCSWMFRSITSFKTSASQMCSVTAQLLNRMWHLHKSVYHCTSTHSCGCPTHTSQQRGPVPNALTSSLSPPLASSPPASLGLKWSQESNAATMNCAAGEAERKGLKWSEKEKEPEKARTLHSLSHVQENEFLTQHKRTSLSAPSLLYLSPVCLSLCCFLLFLPHQAFSSLFLLS